MGGVWWYVLASSNVAVTVVCCHCCRSWPTCNQPLLLCDVLVRLCARVACVLVLHVRADMHARVRVDCAESCAVAHQVVATSQRTDAERLARPVLGEDDLAAALDESNCWDLFGSHLESAFVGFLRTEAVMFVWDQVRVCVVCLLTCCGVCPLHTALSCRCCCMVE